MLSRLAPFELHEPKYGPLKQLNVAQITNWPFYLFTEPLKVRPRAKPRKLHLAVEKLVSKPLAEK